MNDKMLAVLMYLLEKHIDESCQLELDQKTLLNELKQAGFRHAAIAQALNWLYAFKQAEISIEQEQLLNSKATRVFCDFEYQRLDWTCLGFILFLERIEILTAVTRELVLDCLLAIEEENLTITDIKWVTLIVLFNQPGEKTALRLMEQLVLHEQQSTMPH